MLGEDKIGENWIAGPGVAKRYWKNEKETKETFDAYLGDTAEGPFLRTGDLGFLHREEIFITGRIKDLIIIRGINYFPQDIEFLVENSAKEYLQRNSSAVFSMDFQDEESFVIVVELKRKYSARK